MVIGKFITFEGGEGCGKSTQANLLYEYFKKNNFQAILTREPGGVLEAEKIREILKNPEYSLTNLAQLYLFSASRHMFVERVVKPNLENGISVISDRYTDSTRAYQGYAGGGNLDNIEKMIQESTEGISPDLTFIIDIDPKKGLSRELEYSSFSKQSLDYHKRVRDGFVEISKQNPNRCVLIPYLEGRVNEMHRIILDVVRTRYLDNMAPVQGK